MSVVDKNMVIKTFEGFRSEFQPFYDRVKGLHEANPSKRQRGHNMDHNVHVALHGIDVCLHDHPGQPNLLKAVFMSAITHSLDRLVERNDQEGFEALTHSCLELVDVGEGFREEIFIAVMDHGKKNDVGREDSLICVILKDADRIANIGAALAIRSGQFTPDIPPYEMAFLRSVNPTHSYHNPASVLEDLRECFVWGDWMRTSRGKEIFGLKAKNLRLYLDLVAGECEMIGMDRVVV